MLLQMFVKHLILIYTVHNNFTLGSKEWHRKNFPTAAVNRTKICAHMGKEGMYLVTCVYGGTIIVFRGETGKDSSISDQMLVPKDKRICTLNEYSRVTGNSNLICV